MINAENYTAACPCCKKRIAVQKIKPDVQFRCQICGSQIRRTTELPSRLVFARPMRPKAKLPDESARGMSQSNIGVPLSPKWFKLITVSILEQMRQLQGFVFSKSLGWLILGIVFFISVVSYAIFSSYGVEETAQEDHQTPLASDSSLLLPVEPEEAQEEFSVPEIVSMYDKSVCRVEAGNSLGTGFVIGPQLVVSNRHVIQDADASSIRLFFPDGTVDPEWTSYGVSELIAGVGRTDLVVLKVPRLPAFKAIPIESMSRLQRGEPIIIIGNPDGLCNVVSQGNLGSIQTLGSFKYVQLTSTIHQGNSGGPAITRRGKLAGVVTWKSINNEGIGFAIPGEQLYEFLNSALAE